MKPKSGTIVYASLQMILWGSFGITVNFAAKWFDAYQLSSSVYGVVMCVACVLAFACQMVFSDLVSRLPRMTLRGVLSGAGTAMLLSSLALLFGADAMPSWLKCALYAVPVLAIQAIPAFLNALGMEAERAGVRVRYGLSRGLGSLSYGLLAYLVGALIPLNGVRTVFIAQTALSVLMIVMVLVFPSLPKPQTDSRQTGNTLLRNRRFLLTLLGALLLYLSHNFLGNFLYYAVVSRGGNETSHGICTMIAAVCELPAMFLFTFMLRRLRCDIWLKLSGVFMALRALGCLLSVSVGGIYASMLCQALGFSVLTVASVFYIEKTVAPQDAVRAQALFYAMCTFANAFSYASGGFLQDALGVNSVLALSAVFAGAGALLFVFCLRKVPKAEKKEDAIYEEG